MPCASLACQTYTLPSTDRLVWRGQPIRTLEWSGVFSIRQLCSCTKSCSANQIAGKSIIQLVACLRRDVIKTVTPGRARLGGYRPAGARIYEYVAHDGDGVTAGCEKCSADSCTEAWLQRSEAAAAKCGDCSGARNRNCVTCSNTHIPV